MDEDAITSPMYFDAGFQIPRGLRIETERYGRLWICSLKGDTVASVGGIVWKTDPVFVCPVLMQTLPTANKLIEWLKNQGYENVRLSYLRIDSQLTMREVVRETDLHAECGYCPD